MLAACYFYIDQRNFKENLWPLISSLFHVIYMTDVSEQVWSCSQGDIKMGELAYYGKSVLIFQSVFTPFYTSDMYDTYMDGCDLVSASIYQIQM